jgi:alpha-ketoglutarate-dependent taurine dioxygenase
VKCLETINSHELLDKESLISCIQFKLEKFDSVLVHTSSLEESNNILLNLISVLGTVSIEDVTVPDFETSDYLHRVEICKKLVKDKYGFRPLSTTDAAIPCHTEDYFIPNPSNIIIFQCIRQDNEGGKSIISYLDDILSHIDIKTLEQLKICEYPSYFGKTPILEADNYGKFKIRYNRSTLKKATTMNGVEIPLHTNNTLEYLDIAINKSQTFFKLVPGDIWIVNNQRVLHGRTALSKETNRLLKRVKIYT